MGKMRSERKVYRLALGLNWVADGQCHITVLMRPLWRISFHGSISHETAVISEGRKGSVVGNAFVPTLL